MRENQVREAQPHHLPRAPHLISGVEYRPHLKKDRFTIQTLADASAMAAKTAMTSIDPSQG